MILSNFFTQDTLQIPWGNIQFFISHQLPAINGIYKATAIHKSAEKFYRLFEGQDCELAFSQAPFNNPNCIGKKGKNSTYLFYISGAILIQDGTLYLPNHEERGRSVLTKGILLADLFSSVSKEQSHTCIIDGFYFYNDDDFYNSQEINGILRQLFVEFPQIDFIVSSTENNLTSYFKDFKTLRLTEALMALYKPNKSLTVNRWFKSCLEYINQEGNSCPLPIIQIAEKEKTQEENTRNEKLDELEDRLLEEILYRNTPSAFQFYKETFPNGKFVDSVDELLKKHSNLEEHNILQQERQALEKDINQFLNEKKADEQKRQQFEQHVRETNAKIERERKAILSEISQKRSVLKIEKEKINTDKLTLDALQKTLEKNRENLSLKEKEISEKQADMEKLASSLCEQEKNLQQGKKELDEELKSFTEKTAIERQFLEQQHKEILAEKEKISVDHQSLLEDFTKQEEEFFLERTKFLEEQKASLNHINKENARIDAAYRALHQDKVNWDEEKIALELHLAALTEKAVIINEDWEEVNALKKSLQIDIEKLEKDKNEIAAKDEESCKKQLELEQISHELEERKEELLIKQDELNCKEKGLVKKHHRLAQAKESIEKQEKVLKVQNESLAKQTVVLEKQKAESNKLIQVLINLETSLRRKEQSLKSVEKDLQQKAQRLAKSLADLSSREKALQVQKKVFTAEKKNSEKILKATAIEFSQLQQEKVELIERLAKTTTSVDELEKAYKDEIIAAEAKVAELHDEKNHILEQLEIAKANLIKYEQVAKQNAYKNEIAINQLMQRKEWFEVKIIEKENALKISSQNEKSLQKQLHQLKNELSKAAVKATLKSKEVSTLQQEIETAKANAYNLEQDKQSSEQEFLIEKNKLELSIKDLKTLLETEKALSAKHIAGKEQFLLVQIEAQKERYEKDKISKEQEQKEKLNELINRLEYTRQQLVKQHMLYEVSETAQKEMLAEVISLKARLLQLEKNSTTEIPQEEIIADDDVLWKQTRSSGTLEAFQNYLTNSQEGVYQEEAKMHIDTLQNISTIVNKVKSQKLKEGVLTSHTEINTPVKTPNNHLQEDGQTAHVKIKELKTQLFEDESKL